MFIVKENPWDFEGFFKKKEKGGKKKKEVAVSVANFY